MLLIERYQDHKLWMGSKLNISKTYKLFNKFRVILLKFKFMQSKHPVFWGITVYTLPRLTCEAPNTHGKPTFTIASFTILCIRKGFINSANNDIYSFCQFNNIIHIYYFLSTVSTLIFEFISLMALLATTVFFSPISASLYSN